MRDQDVKLSIEREAQETIERNQWIERVKKLIMDRYNINAWITLKVYDEYHGMSPEDAASKIVRDVYQSEDAF